MPDYCISFNVPHKFRVEAETAEEALTILNRKMLLTIKNNIVVENLTTNEKTLHP